jgi:uncharacterized protein (DUF983 family)
MDAVQGEAAMTTDDEPVTLAKAVGRGFMMKCPNCGKGNLFGRFLKVTDHCSVCGETYSHHRADDFPAYLVMVVVGHLIVPAILAVETEFAPPFWLQFLVWIPLTIISSLALLQPTKGAIVGLQWQMGMHGFAEAKEHRLVDAGRHFPTVDYR